MSAITQQDRGLIALILSPVPLAEILEKTGLPVDQLLDWADSPPIRRILDRLQGFAAFRTTLTASLAGPRAATALSTLLEAAPNPVERRRLATTLIRTGKPARAKRSLRPHGADTQEREPPSSRHEEPAPTHTRAAVAETGPATTTKQPTASAGASLQFLRSTRVSALMQRAGATELPRAG